MKLYIVAVHDRQLAAYMRPFIVQSLGQALRGFRDEVNRNDSELNKHPEDYELHQLGEFDDQTGQITGLQRPEQLGIASNFLEISKQKLN